MGFPYWLASDLVERALKHAPCDPSTVYLKDGAAVKKAAKQDSAPPGSVGYVPGAYGFRVILPDGVKPASIRELLRGV
jgi:hypothetical protein